MKVSSAAFNENYGRSSKKAILPLVPIETDEVPSNRMITHTLRSNPADANGPKYKLQIGILQGNESCRTIIDWRKGVQQILTGLAVDTHAPAIPIVETLMAATPRAIFLEGVHNAKVAELDRRANAVQGNARNAIINNGMDHEDNLTFEQIQDGLKYVVRQLLPRRVLARAKRYVRRDCRKPVDMKVRNYVQNLLRINDDEFPRLPPFEEDQKFSDDEMMDIILFGTPNSWQKEMDRQGFDPVENTIDAAVDFMERIEDTEDFDADRNTKPAAKKSGHGNKSGKKSTDNKGKSEYFCLCHGKNSSHNTEDCHKMINEAKRLKKADGKGDGKSGNGKYGNKTWSRKADEASKAAKQDLASFIRKEIKKGVKKDLKAISKKRKSDDSEASEGELNAFDLKDFNYQDMENLKIDDEDILDEISA